MLGLKHAACALHRDIRYADRFHSPFGPIGYWWKVSIPSGKFAQHARPLERVCKGLLNSVGGMLKPATWGFRFLGLFFVKIHSLIHPR